MDMLEVVLTRPDGQVYALVTSTTKGSSAIELITPTDVDNPHKVYTDIHHARYSLIRRAREDEKMRVGKLPRTALWSKFPIVKPKDHLLLVIHGGRLNFGGVVGSNGNETLYIKGHELRQDESAWWSYICAN